MPRARRHRTDIEGRPAQAFNSILGVTGALVLLSIGCSVGAASRDTSELPRPFAQSATYTEVQSRRGEAVYTSACASCHSAALTGGATLTGEVPGLVGDEFANAWSGMTAGDLFERIRTSMPPNRPGTLTPQDCADVTAYILSKNRFPAGQTDLGTDVTSLRTISLANGQAPRDLDPMPDRSVLDGVYSQTQLKRGADTYARDCANCHGPTLAGKDVVPSLIGADFLGHWTGSTAGDFFERIRASMPQDRPGSLGDQEYADVIAYIFNKNRFPAGPRELDGTHATLRMIRIETKKER